MPKLTKKNAAFKSFQLIGHAVKLSEDLGTVLSKKPVYLVEHTYDKEKAPMTEKLVHWSLASVMREKAGIPKDAFCYLGTSEWHAFFDVFTKYAGELAIIKLPRPTPEGGTDG